MRCTGNVTRKRRKDELENVIDRIMRSFCFSVNSIRMDSICVMRGNREMRTKL